MRRDAAVRAWEASGLLEAERSEWTVGDLVSVLRRRRAFVFWPAGILLVLVTVYCLVATPRYQATGEIEVQKEAPGVFGLESSVTGDAQNADSGALDYSMTLETEARILESSTLALEVIRDLKLETTRDYFPQRKPGLSIPRWVKFWAKPVEPLSVPLDQAPNRRYVALKIFAGHLKITPVTGTRLIEVSYSDPDPQMASAVVNRLIQALTDYTFQARFSATAQASSWLARQLTDLKSQTEVLQERATRLHRETGMFGEDEAHNIVLARLESLNQELAAAESNRLLKEAIYRVSESGDPELISGLAGNAGVGAAPAMMNSLALIQTLRGQEASVQAELAEDDTRYGSAYPRVGELRAQMGGIEKSIQEEVHRIGERSRTDFEIATKAEDSARDALEQQKVLANEMNDKAVAYGLAKQEADSSRNVYQGLLAKLKEAGVLEGLRSTNLTVVSPGLTPPPNRPKSPNVPLYYAGALMAGLFLGSASALMRELTDHSVRSLNELENLLGAPLLGVVPRLAEGRRPARLPGDRSGKVQRGSGPMGDEDFGYANEPFAEGLRSLRTALLLLRNGQPPQVVLMTSSVPGEGKSKLAVNLAGMLAQLGARVLLVDADLRCPTLHQELGLERSEGLGAALESGEPPEVCRFAQLPTLSAICGDETPARPAELLGSPRMHALLAGWRAEYDFVLLDSPPVLSVTDGVILSQMSDATLLVTRHGYTAKKAVKRSFQLIQEQLPKRAVLRPVLNGVSAESEEYFEYYGYKAGVYGPKRRGRASA